MKPLPHLAILLFLIFASTCYSADRAYFGNLEFELSGSYGTFQNGLFYDSGNVDTHSPVSVRKETVTVRNNGLNKELFMLAVDYSGEIVYSEPTVVGNTSSVNWHVELWPSNAINLTLIGKDLVIKNSAFSALGSSGDSSEMYDISNKQLMFPKSDRGTEPINPSGETSSVVEQSDPTLLLAILNQQSETSLYAQAALVVFVGLAVLILVGGASAVLSSKERIGLEKEKVRIRWEQSESY